MNQSFARVHRRLSIPRPLFAALDWDPDAWLRCTVLGDGRMLIEKVPARSVGGAGTEPEERR